MRSRGSPCEPSRSSGPVQVVLSQIRALIHAQIAARGGGLHLANGVVLAVSALSVTGALWAQATLSRTLLTNSNSHESNLFE
jgi:hypothetical protein